MLVVHTRMRAKLCATVTGKTMEELRTRRDETNGADVIELRLDYVDTPDVAGALAGRQVPVVVTCRPTWEGGCFRGAEEERRRILQQALDLGAEYVDFEWQGGFDDLVRERDGRNVVLSNHDFEGVPDDLETRYRAMRATGAEVVKMAVLARRLSDSLDLMDLGAGSDDARVLVAMGPAGVPSRLLPDRFGSAWTYAGVGVAPGQLDIGRMLGEFSIRAVSDATALYGVLGSPLTHSLSPVMHNAGFVASGIDAVYVPMEAADVDDFWTFATRMRLRGVSVTAPFKEHVVPGLTTRDGLARQVGAVNTVRATEMGWEGINTDVPGFLDPLAARMDLGDQRATVLGAGGAARGVAVALAREGAQVCVCARNSDRAAEVARLVDGTVGPIPPNANSWDLLVNTTPVGTFPDVDASPLPGGPFGKGLVYDLVYNPPVTRLMAEASAAGCDTVGGLPMLVAQAVRQFEWWTGTVAPVKVFRQAAEGRLSALIETRSPRES